jgi:hypothetical protein
MLSILIPTKDYDCHLLVAELHRQGEELGHPFEILLGEDGTCCEMIHLNSIADTLPHSRRITSVENIGRARMRNRLAREAQYPKILFIDCDAVVERKDFLKQYVAALEGNAVVCGGLYHAAELKDKRCRLRFRYEKNADKKRDAATRTKRPYNNFTSFNFAMDRELFLTVLFNEGITRYGYEDTLFGKELEKRNIPVLHTDNRLLHNGLEENCIYLSKVEQSLYTLAEVEHLIGSTPLLDTIKRLERWHMKRLFMIAWRATRRMMRKNLIGNTPSIKILNIYKAGFYISLSDGKQ